MSKKELTASERITLPLDVSTAAEASALVSALSGKVGIFKVGYQLGYGIGWQQAYELVTKAGGQVFFDVKLCDIPNTVGAAVTALAKFKPAIINVHASCGIEAMQAAVVAKGDSLMFAVTVLTSIAEADCERIFGNTPAEKVVQLALDAKQAGVDGLICSPLELELLRGHDELKDLYIMTPGVRPEWAAANDQKRVMTPAEAVKAGADYLVVGRPITEPPAEVGSPADAAQKIIDEIGD